MDWRQLHGDVFANKRVLVTGAAGFIGSHLVEALVALGSEIVALDDLSRGTWDNLRGFDSGVRKVTASILDEAAVDEATQGCRFVFHQAALGSVPMSVEQPLLYHEVNVLGTVKVLEAARKAGVQRVMFAASSSAYGDPPGSGDAAKVESMEVLPRSPYAATKVACEAAVRAWAHSYGLDTVSLRYFNIFGPRQDPNSAYAAVIAAFAKAMIGRKAGMIFGDGDQSRDFTFVANAVHANLLAARCGKPLEGAVLNVAMGQRITVNELHRQMAAYFGVPDKPSYRAVREGDVLHSLADLTRTRAAIGYSPLVDFSTGLKATCEWYAANLPRIPGAGVTSA